MRRIAASCFGDDSSAAGEPSGGDAVISSGKHDGRRHASHSSSQCNAPRAANKQIEANSLPSCECRCFDYNKMASCRKRKNQTIESGTFALCGRHLFWDSCVWGVCLKSETSVQSVFTWLNGHLLTYSYNRHCAC